MSVVTVTVIVSLTRLPLVSCTVTVITLAPATSGMLAAVPVRRPAAAPLAPRSLAQVIDAMPVSSAAVPARVMNGAVAVVAGSGVGEVMVMVGTAVGALSTLMFSIWLCVTRV